MIPLRQAVVAALLIVGACSGSPPASPSVGTAAPSPSASLSSSSPSPARTAVASRSASPAATEAPVPFAWARLQVDGPGAREDHTWTVDASGESAWLFGGRDRHREFGDLWRYDLAADRWQAVEVRGERPAARFGHGAAWLPGTGLVVWAGQAGTTFFADLWAFDPTRREWRRLTSRGDVPAARYGSCLALGPDGRLWISHGFTQDAGRFGDTRAWDARSGTWSNETPGGPAPVVRCLHDCIWTRDGQLLLYAGQTTGIAAIGDLWSFQRGTWTQAPEPEPAPRQLYAIAHDGQRAWVFGGGDVDRHPLDDLWQLELDGLRWTRLRPGGEAPAARFGAALVADSARGRLLLSGGTSGERAFADVWELPLPASGG